MVRLLGQINRVLMVFAACWAFFLAVNITLDVLGRSLFNQPLTGTHEIIRNSIAMITFLQVAYAVQSKSMLRADFLIHLFPGWLSRSLNVLGYLAGAIIFGLVVYGCIDPIMNAYERGEYEGEGAMRIPVWPTYAVIILGSTLACLSYLVLLGQEIIGNTQPAGDAAASS